MSEIKALHDRADQLLDSGDVSAALQIYYQIIEKESNDVEANYMAGVIQAENGKLDRALDHVNKAIQLDPNDADAHYVLAKIYQALGEYARALQFCHTAVDLDEKFDEAWLLLCSLYSERRDATNAYKACGRAKEFYPTSLQAIFNFANSAIQLGKLSLAKEYFRKAIEIDSSFKEAWIGFILSLKAENNLDAAIEEGEKAAGKFSDDPHVLSALASIYLRTKLYDKAITLSIKALELDQENLLAFNNLGSAYLEGRLYDRALEYFEKALVLSPNNTDILQNIGSCYYKLNQNEVAVAYFKKALGIDDTLVLTKHMLAMAEGRAEADDSRGYVTELFDRYARDYDESQVKLEYRVPEHINRIIRNLRDKDDLYTGDVLDIGCGTGLCGRYLVDICRTIKGVDLSGEMIEKARQLEIYDELVADDMSDYMLKHKKMFDLIFSADVFVYLGSLDEVFQAVKTALKDGGYLVFSVQVDDTLDDYELTDTGRYNHSKTYINALAANSSFEEIYSEDVISRLDYGVPINSRVHVLKVKKSG